MASTFSGKAGRTSAVWTEEKAQEMMYGLQDIYKDADAQARGEMQGYFDPSMQALNDYYSQTRNDLNQGLSSATDTLRQGEASGVASLQQGYGAGLDALRQYYGQGAQTLQQGVDAFNPLVSKNMAGLDMYMNALGLGGQAGTQAAQGAFQTGPGYQFAVDQATGNAQRAANRLGMAYSGNTVDATAKLANNLANQEYGNWIKNLSGFQGGAQSAVSGQAGALQNLASLYQNQANATGTMQANQGRDISSLQSNTAQQIGNAQLGTGQALGQAAANQGSNVAQLNTNFGQSLANLTMGTAQNNAGALSAYYNTVIPAGQQGIMAGQQAAGNRMGAAMGGASALASLFGGAGGFGGFVSSLFG